MFMADSSSVFSFFEMNSEKSIVKGTFFSEFISKNENTLGDFASHQS